MITITRPGLRIVINGDVATVHGGSAAIITDTPTNTKRLERQRELRASILAEARQIDPELHVAYWQRT